MGGGGISPWEWVVPVVGGLHATYNTVAQNAPTGTGLSSRNKLVTPGSPTASEQVASSRREQALGEQRAASDAAAETLRYNTTPQTPQEELAARRRAQTAKQALGSSSASQQLTGTLG